MNNIFQTKQSNNNFYQDTINNDELTIINIENIKNNNTLILNTNTKIAMLLYKSFFIRTKNIFCPFIVFYI